MKVPEAAQLASLAAAGSLLAAAFAVHVASSVPGDTTYGIKEAVVELRTALASGGEARSGRYLDEVDLNIAELTLLAQQGAPEVQVEAAAERAITTERHAQAELSEESVAPETADRYQEHRRMLEGALEESEQSSVRDSLRQVLRAFPQGRPYDRP